MTGPPRAAPIRYPIWVAPVRAVIIAVGWLSSWDSPRAAEDGVRTPAAAPTRQNSDTATHSDPDHPRKVGSRTASTALARMTSRRFEVPPPRRPTRVEATA
jgi:hypothetical protein